MCARFFDQLQFVQETREVRQGSTNRRCPVDMIFPRSASAQHTESRQPFSSVMPDESVEKARSV